MLIGWSGNNGSTFTAGLLANKHAMTWETRRGTQKANFYGSLVMASTVRLGTLDNGEMCSVPMHKMVFFFTFYYHEKLPMVDPTDIVVGGWDISSLNLASAMDRAKVLEPGLKEQVRKEMMSMTPLPSIYYPDFIAANQAERADNVLPGVDKAEHLETIRRNIRDFKAVNKLDKVIVMWTANTERFSGIETGLNDTAENLMQSIKLSKSEVSPSTIFAVASIMENCPFINGSPQNTFVPGLQHIRNLYLRCYRACTSERCPNWWR